MSLAELRYFLINKPRGLVSQFLSSHAVGLLGDIEFDFPEGTHAIGRLDRDSEGLLILTTDKSVTRKIFLAPEPHARAYLVLVEYAMKPDTLQRLKNGVPIRIESGESYLAVPEAAEIITDPKPIYAHAGDPREAYPHTWLLITLSEGKFRQVRKMVQAAGHRCLRLIRLNIGGHRLGHLLPGQVKELDAAEFFGGLGGD
ncbi:MAG: hypothetical protein RL095_2111 [Verrucomicrobiota bacterium]